MVASISKSHLTPFKLLLFAMVLLLSLNEVKLASRNERTEFVSENLKGDGTTMTEMMDYMNKYGYLPKASSGHISHLVSGDEITNAIKMVQKVANLPETGILDDVTARFIKRRRCGVSDVTLINSLKKRGRRFAINPVARKWTKSPLTWRLDRNIRTVSETKVLHDLHRAFQLWSDASSLQFVRVSPRAPADILISFEYGDHGDGYRFDGLGTILAHAFPPTGHEISGDMHMDGDENWRPQDEAILSPDETTSIFVVAAHELGHSLGLDHSSDTTALMFSGYAGAVDYKSLPSDDMQAIQYLYGTASQRTSLPVKPTTSWRIPPVIPTPPPPIRPPVIYTPQPPRPPVTYKPPRQPPRPPVTYTPPRQPTIFPVRTRRPPSYPSTTHSPLLDAPELCHTAFDAVAAIRGELYIFKDKYMWRITDEDHIYGPMLIKDYWLGLPENLKKIDAAYERPEARYEIILFSGKQYWTFNGRQAISRYPLPLTTLGLPPSLPSLDATLVWGHNGKTYFFSNHHYWKYDEKNRRIEAGYPKPAASWNGIPNPITSALRWKDGTTYFFKERLFWKYNDSSMRIDHSTGRLTHPHWFNCPDMVNKGNDKPSTDNSSSRSSCSDPFILLVLLITVKLTVALNQ